MKRVRPLGHINRGRESNIVLCRIFNGLLSLCLLMMGLTMILIHPFNIVFVIIGVSLLSYIVISNTILFCYKKINKGFNWIKNKTKMT